MMRRNRVLWMAGLVALPLLSLSGQAAEHAYVGVEAGWTHSHGACEEHARSCGNDSVGGGIFVGYRFNDWLALEVGYDDLGTITADYPARGQPDATAHYEGETQGVELAAKPYWQVNENFALFAKLGTLAWSMEVTGHEVTFEHHASDDGWSPLVGAGAEFTFGRHWTTLLEYQWLDDIGGSSTGHTDVSVVNLGVAYHFGAQSGESLAFEPATKPPAHKTP